MDQNLHISFNSRTKFLIGIFLLGAVFSVDLNTPLGIADGMSYVLIVLLTIWTESKIHTLIVAAVSIVLVVLGYYLSPESGVVQVAVTNRFLSAFCIIAAAFIITKYKGIEDVVKRQRTNLEQMSGELKETNAHLEDQVKVRTQVLQEALRELENSKQELNSALEHEKELNALKTRIVSMASHEFRTPLATILSSLALISKYNEMDDKEKQRKHIVRIRSAISHLTDLLEDTLSVSKLDEGKMKFSPETICIDNFVSELVNEMQALVKAGQKIIYSHNGHVEIVNDKKVLKRIMINLISNAIKFSDENTVINISTNTYDKSFDLKIQDQGIGIPESEQKRLFERFFRAENAFNIQGTGLGLCIVAKYVELLNGSIQVDSKENAGSAFTVKLPVIAEIKTDFALAS